MSRLTDRIRARLQPAPAGEAEPERPRAPVPQPGMALPFGVSWITYPGMPSQAPAAPLIRAESPAPIMRTIAPVSKEDPWGDFA